MTQPKQINIDSSSGNEIPKFSEPYAPQKKDIQRSSESLQQRKRSPEKKESAADKALWVKVEAIFKQYDKNGDG